LAGRDDDLDRQAAGLDDRVDFRARPAARAADRLAAATYLIAPAACWWARAMELSIM